MEKLIVTETFMHADGPYRISYFTHDDPALNRVTGSTPALVATIELELQGSWQVVYRWVFVPVRGQRTLLEYTLTTPPVSRIPITISKEELDAHLNTVYSTLAPKLDLALRREPMPAWKMILAILLFDAAFTFALWLARIPAGMILGLQIPLILFSCLYFWLARHVLDRIPLPGRR